MMFRTIPTVVLGSLVSILLASPLSARAQGVVLPLPPKDQQEITKHLGPGVVGAAVPSKAVGDPASYFPLQAKAPTFKVTSGPNRGKTQTLRVAQGKRPGGNPAWRFELSPTLAGFLRQTPEGDLLMPAVSDSGEGVIVVTTPANPFVLKGMKPGERRSFSQKVAVNYLDDPTDTRYSGSLNGTYTFLGSYQLTVPAGTYATDLFRLECQGKVGPAHTQDAAYYFFAPGKGIVAMVSEEEAEAFYIIHIDSTSGKVLASE